MWSSEQVRPGIWVGFTDVTAGNLAFHVGDNPALVGSRRQVVETSIAAGAGASLAYMNQVHGADVAVIDGSVIDGSVINGRASALGGDGPGGDGPGGDSPGGDSRGGAPTADAMVTAGGFGASGLAVMVADCVPVVLVGETSAGAPVLAVAHAGRPGVEKGVIKAVVAQMRRAGAVQVQAWLGPSVCGRCYEVPAAMRTTVAQKVPESYAKTSWGTPALDLPAAVLAQLGQSGVLGHPSEICTLEDPRYFSHRRAQRDGESEGRFIGFVAAVAPR